MRLKHLKSGRADIPSLPLLFSPFSLSFLSPSFLLLCSCPLPCEPTPSKTASLGSAVNFPSVARGETPNEKKLGAYVRICRGDVGTGRRWDGGCGAVGRRVKTEVKVELPPVETISVATLL